MKVWITQYALSAGIKVIEGAEFSKTGRDMVTFKDAKGCTMYAHGNAWHRTEAEAIADAERRRVAKIASLKKQLAKLERLSFQPITSAHQQEPQS